MEIVYLLISVITAAFIGCNILYCVCGRKNRMSAPETVFISYGLGLGFISLEMLLFYFFKWQFSVAGLLAPWLPLFAVNLALYLKAGRQAVLDHPPQAGKEKGGVLSVVLTAGIAFEIVYAFFRALIKPIESYDAIAIYAIKSKMIYLARSIPQDFFAKAVKLFPHPDYPLNIPLAETFIYIFLGSLNDQLAKIIFPLYFAGILAILYFAIRRFAARTYALLFTFVLASVPQFNNYATNAYLEVPLAFYCFTSALFLFRWFEDRKNVRLLILSAGLAALGGWTKNEGLLYCAVNMVLICLFLVINRKNAKMKDIIYPVLYFGLIVLILAPWSFIKAGYNITNSEINLVNLNPVNLVRQLHKLGPIFYELQKQLFGPKKWNILWVAVFITLIFNYKKVFRGAITYISVSILLALSGYILFYMISYVDVVFFASKTWARFLLNFLPVLVYWLACMLKEDVKI